MIPIAKPLLGKEEQDAVREVLKSGRLVMGEKVHEFEEVFAKYCGVKYAIATSSGTTALHLSLLAHGIGPGDEVVTTPYSFIATANCIQYVGAKPVFVDIELDTFTIDASKIGQKLTKRTKAILPVHIFGHPANMENIVKIGKKNKLIVIEDAAQAHGAVIKGRKVGTFGTGCFSFYPTKNITTGEGGMVTTNDAKIADRIRLLRNHGMHKRYSYETVGYNFRMTDISAAIGIVQLTKLDRWNKIRIANANYLTQKLKNLAICPVVRPNVTHVFHQYTVRIPQIRDRLRDGLSKKGIDTGIYYHQPIHREKTYKFLGHKSGDFPFAEKASREVLSLPIHPSLTKKDLNLIVSAITNIMT